MHELQRRLRTNANGRRDANQPRGHRTATPSDIAATRCVTNDEPKLVLLALRPPNAAAGSSNDLLRVIIAASQRVLARAAWRRFAPSAPRVDGFVQLDGRWWQLSQTAQRAHC